MLVEIKILFIYFLVSLSISLIAFFLSFILIPAQKDIEKTSSYECGFNPFDEARNKFDIRFYLVAILFLVFDLEIVYLFPWVKTLTMPMAFWLMILFLLVLLLGFVYEWKKNALEWS